MKSLTKRDYKPPRSRRYEFLQKSQVPDCTSNSICAQITKHNFPKSPKLDLKGGGLWTCGPTGKLLVQPRLIRHETDRPEPIEETCFDTQPNRFLKTMKCIYTDLYEKLKRTPQDDIPKKTGCRQVRSTYQADIGHLSEYLVGHYDKDVDVGSAVQATPKTEECSNKKKYAKPVVTIPDSTSHWDFPTFTLKPFHTRYRQDVGRVGCVVIPGKMGKYFDYDRCRKDKKIEE